MNIPPFRPLARNFSGNLIVRERCTYAGAEDTAREIKAHWRECGHANVEAEVVPIISTRTGVPMGIFAVVTNLVGGLPPKAS